MEASKLNTENKRCVLSSLAAGFIVALITIFSYHIAFSIGNFLLGKEHYMETTIMMVMFSISSGAYYSLLGKRSSKSSLAMIVFFITLYAGSRFISVFEIHLFVIITIITATLLRILLWFEVKKIVKTASNTNCLSENE